MFPKVPQSSLGILRIPQLHPPLGTCLPKPRDVELVDWRSQRFSITLVLPVHVHSPPKRHVTVVTKTWIIRRVTCNGFVVQGLLTVTKNIS